MFLRVWTQILPLDLKNSNSNIIFIIAEKGGGDLQKDFSSCFLRALSQITRLKVRNPNSNIILIRGVKRGGGYPQKKSCFLRVWMILYKSLETLNFKSQYALQS